MFGAMAQLWPLPKSLVVLTVQGAKSVKLQDNVVDCLYKIASTLDVSTAESSWPGDDAMDVSADEAAAMFDDGLMDVLLRINPFSLTGKVILQPLIEASLADE